MIIYNRRVSKFLWLRGVGARPWGEYMTIIEIIDTFTFYGIDVIALAAVTAALVQLCKATFLKRVQKKLFTFLPFVIGTLLYAAYAAVCNLSLLYLAANYVSVLEHGISVGAAATLLYVLYEQFVRQESGLTTAESVVKTLIGGYVAEDAAEDAAKRIAEAVAKDVTGGGAKRTAEILTEAAQDGVTENDIAMLSRLIIETLAHLHTA